MSSQRTNIPNSLNEHWMPFSDNKSFKKNPRLITDAKGVYLTNHLGKKMIDASSGLFCNPLGHGRKEITEAVSKQLEKLDYCQPFNQGFGGSFELLKLQLQQLEFQNRCNREKVLVFPQVLWSHPGQSRKFPL